MDYPKSVPGVGLVDGKFVDENQVTGQVGSLIPSAWGNAVTDEILTVIAEGAEAPDEARTDQLRAGILGLLKSAAAKATELVAGTLRIGTQVEVNSGALDTVAVTPKKLRFGMSASFGSSGYILFPTWFFGLVFQWGSTGGTVASGQSQTVTLPITLPNGEVLAVIPVINRTANDQGGYSCAVDFSASGASSIVIRNTTSGSGNLGFRFFLLGR